MLRLEKSKKKPNLQDCLTSSYSWKVSLEVKNEEEYIIISMLKVADREFFKHFQQSLDLIQILVQIFFPSLFKA